MKYLRVKPEYDNRSIYKLQGHKLIFHGILIENELYTQSEINRMIAKGILISSDLFEIVEIPKSKIYHFFGCRKEARQWKNKHYYYIIVPHYEKYSVWAIHHKYYKYEYLKEARAARGNCDLLILKIYTGIGSGDFNGYKVIQ